MRGRKKSIKVYLEILEAILYAGGSISNKDLCRALNKSPSSLRYYTRQLERAGLILPVRSSITFWEITPKGRQIVISKNSDDLKKMLGISETEPTPQARTPQIHSHNLKVVIPIIKRGHDPDTPPDTINKRVKNWVAKYYKAVIPNVTIQIGTKSITLHIHKFSLPRGYDFPERFVGILHNIIHHISEYFERRLGWVLDHAHIEVKWNEYQIEVPEVRPYLKDGVKVVFPNKATSPTGEINDQEKAWVDDTPERKGTETQSWNYTIDFLRMPREVQAQRRALEELTNSIRELVTHLKEVTLLTIQTQIHKDSEREGGSSSSPSFHPTKYGGAS